MGRSYVQELSELAATQETMSDDTVDLIAKEAIQASSAGLIVVASGGAKVVAEWACRLHRHTFGSAAVALTPLEYACLNQPVRATTWLLSSGGRHPDIHQAAQAAKRRGDATVVGIIGQSDSPLATYLEEELGSHVVSLNLGRGIDGFLATNSVWSMACVLAKAYARWVDNLDGAAITQALLREILAWAAQSAQALQHSNMLDRDLVVLHDPWGALGAQDLETRLIESSMASLWTADFRNFGHGRHYWLADRGFQTAVIAIWTPEADYLARASLAVLPKELVVHEERIPYEGLSGALASLAWSIHATMAWGQAYKRDPGRPGVPHFGELLYEGGFPYPRARAIDSETSAISSKIALVDKNDKNGLRWSAEHRDARQRLMDTTLSAIVFDFDGTLIDSARRYEPLEARVSEQLQRLLNVGIRIGIATGRGDSVQTSLRKALPEHLWSLVLVGYHNGATVLPLNEDVPDLDGSPTDERFQRACHVLTRDVVESGFASMRARRNQFTLTPTSGQTLGTVWRATKEALISNSLKDIDVWLSSHSVDVLAPACSKLHVVEAMALLAKCPASDILRIGDRGAWPGNDWELLNARFGFSVDQCSADLSTCWNIGPSHFRGVSGTVYLLERLQPHETGVRLHLEEVSK